MITFRKYLELDEHPNLRQRIMTKINPLEKIKKLSATKKDLSTKAKVIGGQIKGLRQTLKPK